MQNVLVDGDVRLVFGENGSSGTRVSSVIMSRASSVFRSMLSGGRFREGAELAANGTLEIPLPDDNPKDMILLCLAIHSQHDRLSDALDLDRLVEIAKLADKYDIGEAINSTTGSWISQVHEGIWGMTASEQRQKLLAAAYRLQNKEGFEKVAKSIFLKTAGPILKTFDDDLPKVFKKIYKTLESERLKAAKTYRANVDATFENELFAREKLKAACKGGCTYPEKRMKQLMGRFRARNIWPLASIEKHSLETLMTTVRDKDFLVCLRTIERCEGEVCIADYAEYADRPVRGYTPRSLQRDLVSKAEEVAAFRLCYGCVRKGKVNDPKCAHST